MNVAVPEIVLNEAGIFALIGQRKAAGMAQKGRMNGDREPSRLVVLAEGQVDG